VISASFRPFRFGGRGWQRGALGRCRGRGHHLCLAPGPAAGMTRRRWLARRGRPRATGAAGRWSSAPRLR